MTLFMQTKTIATIGLSRFFTFSFIIYINLFTGASFGQNTTSNNLGYLNNATNQNKHNIKDKASVKNKTSSMNFNSSDLTWVNKNNKPVLKNPVWTSKGSNYNSKPSDKSQFIKILFLIKTAFTVSV